MFTLLLVGCAFNGFSQTLTLEGELLTDRLVSVHYSQIDSTGVVGLEQEISYHYNAFGVNEGFKVELEAPYTYTLHFMTSNYGSDYQTYDMTIQLGNMAGDENFKLYLCDVGAYNNGESKFVIFYNPQGVLVWNSK